MHVLSEQKFELVVVHQVHADRFLRQNLERVVRHLGAPPSNQSLGGADDLVHKHVVKHGFERVLFMTVDAFSEHADGKEEVVIGQHGLAGALTILLFAVAIVTRR